jgi:hypothetical protein
MDVDLCITKFGTYDSLKLYGISGGAFKLKSLKYYAAARDFKPKVKCFKEVLTRWRF